MLQLFYDLQSEYFNECNEELNEYKKNISTHKYIASH